MSARIGVVLALPLAAGVLLLATLPAAAGGLSFVEFEAAFTDRASSARAIWRSICTAIALPVPESPFTSPAPSSTC